MASDWIAIATFVAWSLLVYVSGKIIERQRWRYDANHRLRFNGRCHSPDIWPKGRTTNGKEA